MRIRKNWLDLTTPEQNTYLQAILTLKNTVANPGAPANQRYSRYDLFVLIHLSLQQVRTPFAPGVDIDGGHGGYHFLPWHRKYLLELEDALNDAVPGQNIAIPYWDWTDSAGTLSDVLVDSAFGPNGSGPARIVSSGYFAPNAPAPADLPMWWPAGLMGWNLDFGGALGNSLVRNIDTSQPVATQIEVRDIMQEDTYFDFDAADPENTAAHEGMWLFLEGGPHATGHNWFSGAAVTAFDPFAHMSDMYLSVNDPMFFLHHSNVDRVWAMWQMDGHDGAASYGNAAGGFVAGGYGNDVAHLLYPWVGGAANYSSAVANDPAIDFPDYAGDPAVSISDMLNHRALGYAYATEPVVGLALDRTGSMTGVTPDPMTGMPSALTKWEVAVQGVAGYLQDCETARDAGEAIVTAGVETFRYTGGAGEFAKLFAPPFAVARTGSTSSRASFQTAIAGIVPQGSTPIADALSDTENTLVRPPYGDQPAGETRYLSILTDGKETAQPLLNTLAEPEFSDTIIFAMGFGVGTGWNGVDYAAIQTVVDKGKGAPIDVQQVFHGENAGEVNKFYTHGVAHAIGYDPVVDPVAELLEGEVSTTPFTAGAEDRSFMIVANGFDGDDAAWTYHLVNPQMHRYDDANIGPFAITATRNSGRLTLFLHRNSAADADWIGPWYFVIGYYAKQLPADLRSLRLGMDTLDLLLPSGATRPLEGPHFAVTAGDTRPAPIRPTRHASRRVFQPIGIDMAMPERKQSTVAVDIFARTSMPSSLYGSPSAPYTGATVSRTLELDRHGRRKFEKTHIRARIVRPGYSIGDAYRDQKTITIKERKKFLDRKTGLFDEVAFLATYEQRRPGAFPFIMEELTFEGVDDGRFVAKSDETRYPGTYRVALAASGQILTPQGAVGSPFMRILNAESSLGLKLDQGASAPTWHWRGPGLVEVIVTPQDRLGNLASPGRMPTPILEMEGQVIAAEHVNDFSGTHKLAFQLEGTDKDFLDSSGARLTRAGVTVETSDGQKLALPADRPLKAVLRIGGQRLAVVIPTLIGVADRRFVLPAGSPDVFALNPAERIVFTKAKDAIGAGYRVGPERDTDDESR